MIVITRTVYLSARFRVAAESLACSLTARQTTSEIYSGWNIPLLSPALSAIVEKELRYVTRNAQIRMMTLTPLILLVVRFMNRRRFGSAGRVELLLVASFFITVKAC